MLEVLAAARWPWWLAGILIGLWVPLCYLVLGRGLGVSGGFAHVCALAARRGALPLRPGRLQTWQGRGGGGRAADRGPLRDRSVDARDIRDRVAARPHLPPSPRRLVPAEARP